MPLVVGRDRLGTGDGLVERPEGQEPLAGGDRAAEAGVLDERGLSRGEVAGGAVAEPAAARLDVDALRDRELRARALDVARNASASAATALGSTRRQPLSAGALEVGPLGGVDVERELERSAEASWEIGPTCGTRPA